MRRTCVDQGKNDAIFLVQHRLTEQSGACTDRSQRVAQVLAEHHNELLAQLRGLPRVEKRQVPLDSLCRYSAIASMPAVTARGGPKML